MAFVTRKTTEQMAEESRKATEEGLRQIAEGLKKKNKVIIEEEECFAPSASDSSYESEVEYVKPKSKKRARPDPSSAASSAVVEKLETRIHYMQLDLANAKVELSDKVAELDAFKKRVDSIKKVEDTLALLSGLDFYLKDINGLSTVQLQKKRTLYLEEEMEHAVNCMKAVGQIEQWPVIKDALIGAIEVRRNKNKRIELTLDVAIAKRNFWDKAEAVALKSCIYLLIAVLAWILFIYFFGSY